MLIGLVVANVFRPPGDGMNIDPDKLDASKVPAAANQASMALSSSATSSPNHSFGALTGHTIIAALMVSIIFGAAMNVSGESGGAFLTKGIQALSVVIFKIVNWVMRLAPIGTFGALAAVVANYGTQSLQQLATSSYSLQRPASSMSSLSWASSPGLAD